MPADEVTRAMTDSEHGRVSGDCLFCKIVDRTLAADIVHEGREVVAFADINPQAPYHVQIVPKRHVERISDFSAEQDGAWVAELFDVARHLAASNGLEQGFRLVFNNGPHGGQSVYHVHMHLLGGRQLRWPPG